MTRFTSLRYLIAAAAFYTVCSSQAYAFLGFGSSPINREITSNPSGAAIYYSLKEDEPGTKLGTTPFKDVIKDDKTTPAGYYRVEKEGYKPKTVFVPNQEKPADVTRHVELQAITTIRLKITSTPPGATILFGKDINNISKELGPAPYTESKTDAASEQKPFWEKGVYKALLKGYRPKIISSDRSEESKQINFELEPLPLPPDPPKAEYPDKKTVAWKPVSIDAYKNPDVDLSPGNPLAIMNFKENSALNMGSLAADSLILKLQRKGFVVIERELIEKAIADLNIAAPADKKASSGIELINVLSEPLKTRYFMIGSINEYTSGNENITILPFIPDKEKERYQKEYDAYMAYFKSENISNTLPVKTLQEWELEINAKSQTFPMPIARVSITAKILDVKSGRAVWTGIANASEDGLQKGFNAILSALADSIGEPGSGKTDGKNKR